LYAIVDVEVLAAKGMSIEAMAAELAGAGAGLVQYRDKRGGPKEVLAGAAKLKAGMGAECLLIMNDRVDLAMLAGFGGVHVGQGDLSPEDARKVMGIDGIVGISTHTEEQVRVAEAGAADYVAMGPVFATGTKADAAEVVGLAGVRRARALTGKPLVAIGGITLANCRSVVEAGADSVAVISGLFVEGRTVRDVARDFLEVLG
jgi:thiamine-phosphate pyrophosphorylase